MPQSKEKGGLTVYSREVEDHQNLTHLYQNWTHQKQTGLNLMLLNWFPYETFVNHFPLNHASNPIENRNLICNLELEQDVDM